MRVAVLCPSVEDFYFTPHRSAALGAHTLAQRLREAGHEALVYNLPLFGRQGTHSLTHKALVRSLPLPEALHYLRPFLLTGERGPLSWFTRFQRFGPDPALCADLIANVRPDLILISSFAFAYADNALSLARAVKSRLPHVPLYAGGAGVSVLPEYYVRSGHFDGVMAGEAEGGLSLTGLALPAKQDFQPVVSPTHVVRGKRYVSLMLSRGCPMGCRFCANHLVFGRSFRLPSRQAVIKGLDQLQKQMQETDETLHLNIEDDNLLVEPDFAFWFIEEFSRRFPGASFAFENGIDYLRIDYKDVDRLIKAGMVQFNLSLGALRHDSRHALARSGDPGRLHDLLLYLAQRQVPAVTYFICGLAGDTQDTVAETLLFLSRLPTRIGISPFYAVPGLPDFQDPAVFLSAPSIIAAGSACYPWYNSLSTAQMVTAFRLARCLNARYQGVTGKDAAALDLSLQTHRLHSRVKHAGGESIRPVPGLDEALMEKVLALCH